MRTAPTYRIGEVAERLGITTRTIRYYYEQLGLLPGASERSKGAHRMYTDADIARLDELIRLRDLLGLSLEELVQLVETDEARGALREQWHETTSRADRLRILEAAIPLVERQLALVRARQHKLAGFADDLADKLRVLHERRAELRREPPS